MRRRPVRRGTAWAGWLAGPGVVVWPVPRGAGAGGWERGMPMSDGARGRAGRSVRSLLVPLFKDKWKLLLALAAVVGAAAAAASMMTPQYAAEAKLYVKFGREYTCGAQAGDAELVAESFD